ncbi:MAG: TIGR03960 family B12-binding radical SAM protein [Spirochaetes bacterium]|nr:TIGR03960 family B12-binding radical SAM protein [Spirochaetota bacterium]
MGKLNNNIINNLVFNLRKPARYTGQELNIIRKDDPFIRMAICYPDLYEIGMSNNGIRILYDIANNIEDVACERAFAVPEDFEQKIRSMEIPLYTLESYTPLCELDIIGFNVAYELLYTNILQILDLGRIPLLSKERKDGDPIIIGGGESVSNPMPLNNFFDAFFIGDGEEGITDILNTVKNAKLKSLNRKKTINLLNNVEGVYIPDRNSENKTPLNIKQVKKRINRNVSLNNPLKPIMPSMGIVQERLVIEVTRGCKNMCNYCHSGFYEMPYRYGKPEILRDRLFELLKNAHYSELTLSSLSIADYNYLIRLLNYILPGLIERGISISLPSLKVNKKTLPIIQEISDIRKSSLTFAVESGCEEIRERANKKLQTDDIINIADYIFNNGWTTLKLYFMIGLPGFEEYDEAGAIINLLKNIYSKAGKKKRLNVTISPFIPKPHTPFQWEKQADSEYLLETVLRIKRGLPRSISIKEHNIYSTLLEGVMARGDSRLNEVIYNSYKQGCRLDSWNENFKFEIWEKNLNAIGNWKNYLDRKDENEDLPWSFISTGFESVVRRQRDKMYRTLLKKDETPYHDILDTAAIQEAVNRFKKKYDTAGRIRLKISKTGNAKYISHLDFMAVIIRGLRLIDFPVSFTQGFNKREKISMGFPLPVGIESICELCDVDISESVNIDGLPLILSRKLPEGINVLSADYADKKESIMSITRASEFSVEINNSKLRETFIDSLNAGKDFVKKTKKEEKAVSFDKAVISYEIKHAGTADKTKEIIIKIPTGDENSVRIDDLVLSLADAVYDDFYNFKIVKLGQYRESNNSLEAIK